MLTNAQQTAATSIIAGLSANVQSLEAMEKSLEGQDLGALYVLQCGLLYIKQDGAAVSARGLVAATRYTLEEARKLAPTITNGNGTKAVPVAMAEALPAALARARGLLSDMQAAAADVGL